MLLIHHMQARPAPRSCSLDHHMRKRKTARGLQAEMLFQPQLLEGVEGLRITGKLSIRNAVKNIQEDRHSWMASHEAASQQQCSKALFWEGQSRRASCTVNTATYCRAKF